MSTRKQISANRKNAQKSTGPRTAAGKAVSARNALKSGVDSEAQLLPGEDPAALARLTAEYYLQHQPATPEMRACLDRLIRAEWLQRRLFRMEPMLLNADMALTTSPHSPFDVPISYEANDCVLERLQRRINAAERNFHSALKDLQALPSKTNQTTSEELASFLNAPPEAPPAAPRPNPQPPVQPRRDPYPSEFLPNGGFEPTRPFPRSLEDREPGLPPVPLRKL